MSSESGTCADSAEAQEMSTHGDAANENMNDGTVEHAPSSEDTQEIQQRHSFQSHGRTMSRAGDKAISPAIRQTRFSVSFPVQPSGPTTAPATKSPTAIANPALATGPKSPTTPSDTTFLIAIASQERRVLELKEELAKAEADLSRLKRQWAQHEAHKKRNDAKSVTKLQPLKTSLPSVDDKVEDVNGSSAWMQAEMERRKALLNQSRVGGRTVFAGSKHTRTLSLLSPVQRSGSISSLPPQAQTRAQHPPRKESLSGTLRQNTDDDRSKPRPAAISRASTTSNLSIKGADAALLENGIDREVLLQTGKKMANDFRDGFWTFWEDLRQATVGDESVPENGRIPPPPPRTASRQTSNQTLRAAHRQGSRASLRSSSRGSTTKSSSPVRTKRISPARRHNKTPTVSIPSMGMGSSPALADPSFWNEHGAGSFSTSPASVRKAGKKTSASKRASVASSTSDTGWDAWIDSSPRADSSKESRSSSAASEAITNPTTVSGEASPRVSADTLGKETKTRPSAEKRPVVKDQPLPWPALGNLGPKGLRRTASHLMSEWEKSLTPSPGKEFTGEEDYVGLGSEAIAASSFGTKRD